MADKSDSRSEIFAINYAALAREVAMDILPIAQILQLHQLSEEDWARIQGHKVYQETVAGLVREWESATNVRERVKIKAATGLELQLEVYVSEISDTAIPLAQRVEAGKFLARLGELDGNRDVMGAGGSAFSISINIGDVHRQVDVAPKIIDGMAIPEVEP